MTSRQHAPDDVHERSEKLLAELDAAGVTDYERLLEIANRHIAAALAERDFLLCAAIRELEYVQQAERFADCATAQGAAIVAAGMKMLGLKDLSAEALPAPPAKGEK